MIRTGLTGPGLKKRLMRGLLLGLAAALLSCALLNYRLLGWVEDRTYDLRQFLTVDNKPGDIVIAGIDTESLERLGRWPWDREIHAQAIANLLAAGPQVVGIDVLFTEPSAAPVGDKALQEALAGGEKVVLAGYVLELNMLQGKIEGERAVLPIFDSPVGHVNILPDRDGVLRRAAGAITVPGRTWFPFSFEVLDKGGLDVHPTARARLSHGFIMPKFSAEPGNVPVIPFWQIYENDFPREQINGKIVLIGSTTVGISDYYFTPVGGPMYGVEFHAQVITALHDGELLHEYARPLSLTAFFAFCSALVFSLTGWLTGLLLLVVLVCGYFLYTLFMFEFELTVWPVSYPFFAVSASYILNLGCKVWEERKERNKNFNLFSRYVPLEVAKEMAAAKETLVGLGGQRKEITVLFLDMRGFTALTERMQPQLIVEMLNNLFAIAAAAIFRHGGILDKYIGDAVMAVFNAPRDLPDHAAQAVRTAIEIQESLRAQMAGMKDRFGAAIEVGIGICSGEAIVGNIGTAERLEYTAVGDVVNVAARLEQKAPPGAILLAASTKEKLHGNFPLILEGFISVKGRSQTVEVYRITGRERSESSWPEQSNQNQGAPG